LDYSTILCKNSERLVVKQQVKLNIKLPEWFTSKLYLLWRFVRIFLAGFVAAFAVEAFFGGAQDVRLQVLQAAITGGIAAVFKGIRDGVADDSLVKKLPL